MPQTPLRSDRFGRYQGRAIGPLVVTPQYSITRVARVRYHRHGILLEGVMKGGGKRCSTTRRALCASFTAPDDC